MDLLVTGVLLALCTCQCFCLTVRFQNQQPLHVALGRTLVLEARIDRGPEEKVSLLTWERETEGQGKVRVFPVTPENPRVSTDQQGAKLRVTDFRKEDCGIYIITVMDQRGIQDVASRAVKESELAPEATIPLHCEVSYDSEQWDTPEFVWLVDGVAVSNQTANLSADGSKLYPSGECVHKYTCIANSSLGTSIAHFNTGCEANPNDQRPRCMVPWLITAMVIVVASGALVIQHKRMSKTQHSIPPGAGRCTNDL
ncbi:hypothetical protein AAFF_G00329220 [Aldrovandia affinis]|uniref:Uncharacterized protein n=1 Tax=Aldrovandia affinis TaxID=143900 RepID=A0AAD7SLV2_9TELE|nr:hypothetical protein AAFF_G00329220 [Aldrovandia affinis]